MSADPAGPVAPTAATPRARVGIDVGGTFTDFVLALPGDPRGLLHHKEPSTPDDPARAVADGIAAVLGRAGLDAGDLASITHGTTIGLNAIIQRRGARIALVVTEGYRDILEIGRSRMPSSFDLHAAKEEPLVPRDRIVEIPARLGPDGRPVRTPSDAELARVAEELAATGAEAAAVLVLHGHTDPAFEAEVTARLGALLPQMPLTSSAAIWPEVREFERALVTCLNVYIQPLMRRYFDRLETLLDGLGVTAPVYIAASNGGSLSLRSAVERPIETVLSGPAAGVTAATRLGRAAGISRLVTFDMGGTSSDIAVAVDGEPEFATHTTIGGLPLILPVVAVSAIGAGGGSVVRADEHGVLKVGPESAGAAPGPVAYGRGGTRPTVTDCYLHTGVIDPATFLGGRMTLDARAAARALGEVATGLGFGSGSGSGSGASGTGADTGTSTGADRAADGALRVATAGMAVELQKTLAGRGLDPAEFTLVPFGGAGPTHAAVLAEEVGIREIVVPPTAATFCALGAVGADLRRDFARSLRRELDDASIATLDTVLTGLEEQARGWLAGQGPAAGAPELSLAADMSYRGQAYELRVPLPAPLTQDALREAFHTEHERLYGFRDTDAAISLGTARLAISSAGPEIVPAATPVGARTEPPVPAGHRTVLLAGRRVTAEVHRREALRPGQSLPGPAVIEQDDTTVLVPPEWTAGVDPLGNLRLTRS
ncbi:hydantoinase/oxoprolinase family protein [Streptomyces corynorhini]|uniref:Hydantoinase/oxoprolinase family protein n=1 Tax=Streptomyces corynorhini TaxID=2282652 RepID=A0A370B0V6_9ACTN|nr:hydantoinase/oxoprolinase family protein [Streptomyces corynorhini]RDG35478.1 hydantoinase/oxoprolinase family protein [Streptomyces corynorhini]